MKDLFSKYDIQAPRYTSYPTVPYWEGSIETSSWLQSLKRHFGLNAPWSLYLHIPFCESLCTFCGCNTVITKDHHREKNYVDLVLHEWNAYLKEVSALNTAPLQQLHLGGGTPTFLGEESLERLVLTLLEKTNRPLNFEASIEVDPRRTSVEQLKLLRRLGFQRLSLGVQDFNPEVQYLINRIQPFSMTAEMTSMARELGFQSINFDLIYGLAKQTPESIADTVKKTIQLRPDRIALYSLALVPWIKPAQRLFKDEDLPAGQAKRRLYEICRCALFDAGYVEVGMDHFALPTDSLGKALKEGTLHRNFMGYTDQRTDILLGLGVSAISETPEMFHQNEKVFPVYEEKIMAKEIPSFRGHLLTREDQERRQQILDFMTKGKVRLQEEQIFQAQVFLSEMFSDGLIDFIDSELLLTEKGRPFLRNACVFFDERLKRRQPLTQTFSRVL